MIGTEAVMLESGEEITLSQAMDSARDYDDSQETIREYEIGIAL